MKHAKKQLKPRLWFKDSIIAFQWYDGYKFKLFNNIQMGVSDYYQSEEENEEAKYSATANEDLCIYPHELSGDEMG